MKLTASERNWGIPSSPIVGVMAVAELRRKRKEEQLRQKSNNPNLKGVEKYDKTQKAFQKCLQYTLKLD